MTEAYFGYRLLSLLLILGLNAFFAAAEVSLVSVRPSRLRSLAEEGQTGAQAALHLLANPERLLSVTQLGVTLASLGLGWAGEDTVFELLMRLIGPWVPPQWQFWLHGGALALAFLAISFAHVVIGEVVPKNLAIDRADRLAVLVAPPLLLFHRLSAPFVAVIEGASLALSRMLGLKERNRGGGHSAEELKFIVRTSRSEGHLRHFEEGAIQRLLDLHTIAAREIMVPRNAIVSVHIDATLDQVLHQMIEHQFSRMPVYAESPEQFAGYVHFKDLVPVWEERRQAIEKHRPLRTFRLRRVLRKAPVVPETKPLNQLVEEFRHGPQMALVVDEFGTIAGLVTLEDVLEQVFGEIEDEHDDVRLPPPAATAAVLELEGATNIRDLENQYGVSVASDDGFETLAGYIMFKLGYIPKAGETVEDGARRFTVIEMDRNRIVRVRMERLDTHTHPPPPPPSVPPDK